MLASITFRALSPVARSILDFLHYEHALHGGAANGNLAAPYLQLQAWGASKDDIHRGIQELVVTGFLRIEIIGLRQAGGGEPSRYRLTWMKAFPGTPREMPATHEWKHVLDVLYKAKVGSVLQAKAWLRQQVAEYRRGHTKKAKPRNEQLLK